MITGEQFRAARALLRLEQSEVAEVSGVSLPTIKRLEAASGPISANTGTRDALVRAFNQAGVVFVDDNGQGTGVRFRRPKHAERAKERLDEALEGMARDGIEPLDIQLTAADSAVLQRALGLAEAPSACFREAEL